MLVTNNLKCPCFQFLWFNPSAKFTAQTKNYLRRIRENSPLSYTRTETKWWSTKTNSKWNCYNSMWRKPLSRHIFQDQEIDDYLTCFLGRFSYPQWMIKRLNLQCGWNSMIALKATMSCSNIVVSPTLES